MRGSRELLGSVRSPLGLQLRVAIYGHQNERMVIDEGNTWRLEKWLYAGEIASSEETVL